MLRQTLIRKHASAPAKTRNLGFRWRGGEIARIEGLSDAVFAFAVTLLVVSLEVPKTFNELAVIMRGFTSFAICFGLLMQVWYEQYVFFRRYNMQDTGTVVLNAILLFVALFYVYPLKFLFSFLVNGWMGGATRVAMPGGGFESIIEPGQMPALMAIFSAGYLAVSCIFLLLFYRALRKRSELELTPLEVLETGVSIGASVINAATALASLAIALFAGPGYGALAGIIYPIVLCPGFTIFYTVMGRKKRLMLESADARESESAGTPVA